MPACIVCDETITQPLCAACLERQIRTWLQELLLPEETLHQLRLVTEDIHRATGVTTCIRCGERMGVCGFCYLEHVKAWLRKERPALVPAFSALFGFQLHAPADLPVRPVLAGII